MSTIYSDAAGNKYLGDCRWGNHDINYPTTNWLETGITRATMSSLFNSYLLQTGLRYRNPPGNLWTTSNNFLFTFGALVGDTIDDRYTFNFLNLSANVITGQSGNYIGLYNNSGYTGTNTSASTNRLINSVINSLVDNVYYSSTRYECRFSCVSDGSTLGMIHFQSQKGGSQVWWYLHYAGILKDVNTNFNYYNANPFNHSIILQTSYSGNTNFQLGAKHYIVSAEKSLLQAGRAAYSISCSDGQTPGAQWATDMWVYDNNATLGYPAIGRVPNMLLGIGTYTYLKPVKIIGSVFPDGGSPWYLPVGTYAGKVLLMRCYSSVT